MADWFIARSGQQQGPFDHSAMHAMAASGQLAGDDPVWQEGMSAWTRAAEVPALATLFQSSPSSPQQLSYTSGMSTAGNPQLTDHALEMLRQTRPWVRAVGIIIVIFASLGALAGVFILIGSLFGFAQGGGNGMAAGGMMALFGVFYLGMSVLYMMPGIYLNRYASRITDVMHLRRDGALEQALEAQKSFWKFIGILFLLSIVLWFVMMGAMIVIGVVGAAASHPTTYTPPSTTP